VRTFAWLVGIDVTEPGTVEGTVYVLPVTRAEQCKGTRHVFVLCGCGADRMCGLCVARRICYLVEVAGGLRGLWTVC
jgi:hypothetical protein